VAAWISTPGGRRHTVAYINIFQRRFGEPFKDISNILSIWMCEHLQPNDEREMFHSIQRVNHQSFTFTCTQLDTL